jgi:hypothetical protein
MTCSATLTTLLPVTSATVSLCSLAASSCEKSVSVRKRSEL